MTVLATLVRLALLPVFAGAIFFAYAHALGFLSANLSPSPGSGRTYAYGALVAQGFLSAAAVAVVFSYPLAYVYRHHGFVAALFLTLPVFAVRLPELMDATRNPVAIAMSVYELGAFVVLLVLGTGLAHKRLSRSAAGLQHAPDGEAGGGNG